MNNYIDNLVKNKDILKYIDIYSKTYDYLKQYFYIKKDDNSELYKFIDTSFEENKFNKISMLKDNPEIVSDVIIKITVTPPSTYDYIIDIKVINNYLNDKSNSKTYINSYIAGIYEKIISYINKTYDLNITNFDILYKENKNIDEIILSKIDIFLYIFNIIIVLVVIIFTIVMHVFYIQLYNPTQIFNL
jgi:hypothetical protein